jgi:hypothetical protein
MIIFATERDILYKVLFFDMRGRFKRSKESNPRVNEKTDRQKHKKLINLIQIYGQNSDNFAKLEETWI